MEAAAEDEQRPQARGRRRALGQRADAGQEGLALLACVENRFDICALIFSELFQRFSPTCKGKHWEPIFARHTVIFIFQRFFELY